MICFRKWFVPVGRWAAQPPVSRLDVARPNCSRSRRRRSRNENLPHRSGGATKTTALTHLYLDSSQGADSLDPRCVNSCTRSCGSRRKVTRPESVLFAGSRHDREARAIALVSRRCEGRRRTISNIRLCGLERAVDDRMRVRRPGLRARSSSAGDSPGFLRPRTPARGPIQPAQYFHARRQRLPILRGPESAKRLELGPRRSALSRRAHDVGKHRLRLLGVQSLEGGALAGRGGHATSPEAKKAVLDPVRRP
jgi:hypothetical protein